ncbi:MAG: TetR family transcriptional regulator [Acidimicrobiaceae bacterium]|nr:TetR family transcriptional regulator [Acidimicrobiaceae bacterium]
MTTVESRLEPGDVLVDPAPRVSDPEAGRRSRKKQRTRDDLIAAGDYLFATQGFDATTTTDIAERADVSQRTLFRHFPTKESLLYGDLDDTRLQLRESLASRPADEPILVSVRESMLSLAEDFERHRDRRLLQARLAASSPAVSAYSRAVVQFSWEREIIAAVAARLGVDPLKDPRPEVVAGAAMSAVRIAMRQWTVSGGTLDFMTLNAAALESIASLSDLG